MHIDLHTHSTASDGTDTPDELVRHALAAGIDVLGLTDHDTTAGWGTALGALEALTATGSSGTQSHRLTLVRGVEFSCVHHSRGGRRVSLHLLAYLVDGEHPGLGAEWARLREGRLTRGRVMVERMVQDGYPISWQQVSDLAAGGSVGRPHIGRALVDSGVVADVSTAFRELLSSRQRYWEPKPDTDVFEAIRLVREAGGLPVFAHPLAHRRGPVVEDTVIAAMADAGMVGMEVEHPDHDIHDRLHAAGLARELGLLPLGSSDYHGTNKSTPIGSCLTDPEVYEQLIALPTALRPATGADAASATRP